jgi:hypothetical protein
MRLSRFFRPFVSTVFSVGTLLALVVALLTAPLGAQTAKSRAALYTEIDTNLPSTTGAITAAVLRAQLKNIVASANNTINADAQPIDADLTAIAALTTASYGRSLLTLADAAALRTSAALVIGTDVQAYDADLTAIAALTTASYGRSLLTLADAAALRTSAALVIGTDVQAFDADLTAIAALTTASYGRSLLTLADAAALRTSAALVIGTDVQAYNAELAAISGLSSNGLIARTSSSTAAARTLTGTAGQITVTNGDGVSGNPTLSLPTALTSVNSVTSAAASNLTLGTGTFGTALTFASATGAATFAARIGINGAPANNAGVNLSGIMPNVGGDTNGVGYLSNGTFPASFTAGAHSFYSLPASTASAYTVTNMTGFYAAAPTKGAGSTITNLYGVYVDALTAGTNNWAFRSVGAGLVQIGDTTASTSTTTGSLINAGGFGNAGAIFAGGEISATGGIRVATAGTPIGSLQSFAGDFYISLDQNANGNLIFRRNSGTETMRITGSNGAVSIASNTASTSTTTGSLVNAGGFGNAGAAWFGGQINSASSGLLFSRTGASTAVQYLDIANTGGRIQLGIESSTGGNFFGSSTAYATVLASATTAPVQIAVNATLAATFSSTATTLGGNLTVSGSVRSTSATGGIGYGTGAGGAVTQGTSRTTGVTLNNVCGAITLFTAAGSATWQSFTVTNSTVAATDTIIVNQRSGTDLYMVHVTAVGAGSFRISYATTGGTTSEAPVFNFSVIKAVSS